MLFSCVYLVAALISVRFRYCFPCVYCTVSAWRAAMATVSIAVVRTYEKWLKCILFGRNRLLMIHWLLRLHAARIEPSTILMCVLQFPCIRMVIFHTSASLLFCCVWMHVLKLIWIGSVKIYWTYSLRCFVRCDGILSMHGDWSIFRFSF